MRRILDALMWLCVALLVLVLVGWLLGFVHITGVHVTHVPRPHGPVA